MNIDNDNNINNIRKERISFNINEISHKDLIKNKINPSLFRDQKKECKNCGKKVNAKFIDRNKNTFCSYSCREQFLKNN